MTLKDKLLIVIGKCRYKEARLEKEIKQRFVSNDYNKWGFSFLIDSDKLLKISNFTIWLESIRDYGIEAEHETIIKHLYEMEDPAEYLFQIEENRESEDFSNQITFAISEIEKDIRR